MALTFTILGCGSSGGVPRVGQGWGACDPAEPRNRRRRCSLMVERSDGEGGPVTRVVIDTSPDLREQLIDADVDRLDAVLFTHEHADHTHGIDDLRPLTILHRRRIEVYTDAETSSVLNGRFGYCFQSPPGSDYPPILREHHFVHGERVCIEGPGGVLEAVPFKLFHGSIIAYGFRFAEADGPALAYCPDLHDIPAESLPYLAGLDILIIDALRYAPHPTHLSLSEALMWIERLQPRQAVLTNLHTDLDYHRLASEIPAGVVPAYDGMTLQLPAKA